MWMALFALGRILDGLCDGTVCVFQAVLGLASKIQHETLFACFKLYIGWLLKRHC